MYAYKCDMNVEVEIFKSYFKGFDLFKESEEFN